AFMDRPTTSDFDKAMLSKFLTARPERAPALAPMPKEELKERLMLAKSIETRLWGPEATAQDDANATKQRRLTAFELSVLMNLPIGRLRHYMPSARDFEAMKTLVTLCIIPRCSLLHHTPKLTGNTQSCTG